MSKKLLYVFAGNNGSGKSTYRTMITDKLKSDLNIDTDFIERNLLKENVKNPKKTAGIYSLKLIEDSIKNGVNFSFETTLSSKTSLRQIKLAKQHGFYVVIYYLFLVTDSLNLRRISMRVKQGGHNISTEDVVRRSKRSIDNLVKLKGIADEVHIIDNSKLKPVEVVQIKNGLFEVLNNDSSLPSWVNLLR